MLKEGMEPTSWIVYMLVIILWSTEVTSTCGPVVFSPNPPPASHVQNSTHYADKIYETTSSTIYRCVELCKMTKGCTYVNFERLTDECVLYSMAGPVTSESQPGNWLLIKMSDTQFPASPTLCDPASCQTKQYCRNISGAPLCMNFQS